MQFAALFPRFARNPASRRGAWPPYRHRLTAAGDEGLLGEALDLAHLERRLRRLERGRPDRFAPLPELP